jgi:CubicO group peptidase (beta-lactamase class C family)
VTEFRATQARLEEFVTRGALRGAVVAVGNRTELVWSTAVGSTDGRPISISDRFLLTSITKTLTAVQVLQLVDQGRLDLEQPIAEYLPAFGQSGKESVTAWHVLTHTSGMDQAANTVERSNPRMTAADHLDQALRAGLASAPGSRLAYCSPPFWVLAELITRLSGIGYMEHLGREVVGPCGMTRTSYELGATGDWVAAYGLDDPSLSDQQRRVGYPAGGVVRVPRTWCASGRCCWRAVGRREEQGCCPPRWWPSPARRTPTGCRGTLLAHGAGSDSRLADRGRYGAAIPSATEAPAVPTCGSIRIRNAWWSSSVQIGVSIARCSRTCATAS